MYNKENEFVYIEEFANNHRQEWGLFQVTAFEIKPHFDMNAYKDLIDSDTTEDKIHRASYGELIEHSTDKSLVSQALAKARAERGENENLPFNMFHSYWHTSFGPSKNNDCV